jgi:UDP-glucose 4-epimerase
MDYITVSEIAELATEVMGLTGVRFDYTGGDRGWKGDVPVVRLNTDRIWSLGWCCARTTREALRDALQKMLADGRCMGLVNAA